MGADYSATSGTLHFAAGQAVQTFPIALNPADHFVGTKSAKLVLSGASGVSLGVPNAVLTLSADPAPRPSRDGARPDHEPDFDLESDPGPRHADSGRR